jgi:hypothetical protein
VAWENDKPTVVALREIEENYVTSKILDEKPGQDIEAIDAFAMPEGAEAAPQMPAG